MIWMIKDATIMTQDDEDNWIENGDIVVDENSIVAVGQGLSPENLNVEKVIDGKDKLVIPGLINTHHHSNDRFDKGRIDNAPLEIWQNSYNPPLGSRDWTQEEAYLRTMLNCIEMLKTGTTSIIDDCYHGFPFTREIIDAVFQAYQDVGMRASVSIIWGDKPYSETIPYLDDLLPANLKEDLAQMPFIAPDKLLEMWRSYSQQWRGRVRFILSPSAPQRCTDDFLKETWKISDEFDVPITTHVLETKVQAVTGQLFYGKSIIEYMNSMGFLTPKTNLIHTVWLTDRDIELISEAGSSIVHNPACNLKLGSGIARIRKILDAGINVGLGTDNNSANDTQNMFETMKLAALLHRVGNREYDQWVTAKDVIKMTTRGGARCCCLEGEIGSLSPGMKADMVLIDLKKSAFIPRNNLLHQLVFCEHGDSVDTVIVDGKLVVEDGEVTTVNEKKILEEVMERAEEIQERIRKAVVQGPELNRYVREAYFKCVQQDIGFSPWSSWS